jgi:hypothetical protein
MCPLLFVYAVFCLSVVCYFMCYVYLCVLCLIEVPLSPGKTPFAVQLNKKTKKQPLWPDSASELYRLSDHRLSAKLVRTSADGGCCMVATTDPYGHIIGFLDRVQLNNNNKISCTQF